MNVARIESSRWKSNCYVVSSSAGDAVVIDPGGELDQIVAHVAENDLSPRAILVTHAHYDHVAVAVAVVERYGIPLHLHPGDSELLRRVNLYGALFIGARAMPIPAIDVELADGMELSFGDLEIGVVHVPGHSPGSVCFETEGELFTGDTLMVGRLGRTDLAGGDRDALDASLAMLADRYPPDTTVRPGHGQPAMFGDLVPELATMPEWRA